LVFWYKRDWCPCELECVVTANLLEIGVYIEVSLLERIA
jgi:hypothetical protein